eukprot:1160079-Pelagomonas_calceolata.AAC.7
MPHPKNCDRRAFMGFDRINGLCFRQRPVIRAAGSVVFVYVPMVSKEGKRSSDRIRELIKGSPELC